MKRNKMNQRIFFFRAQQTEEKKMYPKKASFFERPKPLEKKGPLEKKSVLKRPSNKRRVKPGIEARRKRGATGSSPKLHRSITEKEEKDICQRTREGYPWNYC